MYKRVTACEALVQYPKQDTDTNSQHTEHFYHHKDSKCCPFTAKPTSLPPTLPPLNSWQSLVFSSFL